MDRNNKTEEERKKKLERLEFLWHRLLLPINDSDDGGNNHERYI